MPFSFAIDPDRNLIRQTLWGRITVDELREISRQRWADPRHRPGMDVLADLRQAELDVSYDQMTDYTRFLEGNSSIGRQAIVVGRQLEFGLARMYEQLTENKVLRTDLRVFLDMEAAERWIGA